MTRGRIYGGDSGDAGDLTKGGKIISISKGVN